MNLRPALLAAAALAAASGICLALGRWGAGGNCGSAVKTLANQRAASAYRCWSARTPQTVSRTLSQ